jgi:hypothetical protein
MDERYKDTLSEDHMNGWRGSTSEEHVAKQDMARVKSIKVPKANKSI